MTAVILLGSIVGGSPAEASIRVERAVDIIDKLAFDLEQDPETQSTVQRIEDGGKLKIKGSES
jgi:hypothetical protein